MSETTGGPPPTTGPPGDPDRRAELLAGAALDDLDGAEQAELEELAARDPDIARELHELRSTVAALPPAGSGWDDAGWPRAGPLDDGSHDVEPSADLDRRIAALAATGTAPAGSDELAGRHVASPPDDRPDDLADRRAARERRGGWGRRVAMVAASVVLLAGGAAGGIGIDRFSDRPPTGPPGTLGALEDVTVVSSAGVQADVSVMAHTWGTESMMTVSGLEVGSSYTLVLVDAAGAEVPSGTLLGSEVPVVCRMNAAVMRSDATSVQLRDASGAAVVTADLPPAEPAVALG